MQPNQPAAAPTPKKKNNGCLIALGIVGGLFLVGMLAIGIVVWRVAKSEDGQKAMKLIGGSFSMIQKAATAPGTAELRKLGCDPMVFDLAELKGMIDEAKVQTDEPIPELLAVSCTLKAFSKSKPTCAQVAKTYLEAAAPKEQFLVVVQHSTANDPECTALFAASGEELPLDTAELPMGLDELPIPAAERDP